MKIKKVNTNLCEGINHLHNQFWWITLRRIWALRFVSQIVSPGKGAVLFGPQDFLLEFLSFDQLKCLCVVYCLRVWKGDLTPTFFPEKEQHQASFLKYLKKETIGRRRLLFGSNQSLGWIVYQCVFEDHFLKGYSSSTTILIWWFQISHFGIYSPLLTLE